MLTSNIQETASTTVKNTPPAIAPSVFLFAEGLKKSFGGQVVLDHVDLELRQGEIVLLRGENGSGKTTLLNILTGNLKPDAGFIRYHANHTPRTYKFPRKWWQNLNPFDHFTPEFVARKGVGRTWQDVRLFGSQSLRDNIAVAHPDHPGENPLRALINPKASAEVEEKIQIAAEGLLAKLGLAARGNSSADKISLGQSKRVAIARAVSAGAKIIFLDEPLAGLDRQGITDVLSLLRALIQDLHVTMVIIEHIFNQSYLKDLVTADWLLEDGRLQRNGSIQKQTTYKNAISKTRPQRPEWFHLLTGDNAEVIDEPLLHGAILTRIRRHEFYKETADRPVLEVDNLVVNRGHRSIIGYNEEGCAKGFNLKIYKGEICLLQAHNGWGKSTLLDTIMGIIKQKNGRITLDGVSLDELSVWDRVRKGVIALPASHNIFPTLNVQESFQLARCLDGNEQVQFSNQICASLSGGQKQRIALATSDRAGNKRLALFDEPFSMLDSTSIISTINLLFPKNGAGTLILLPATVNL